MDDLVFNRHPGLSCLFPTRLACGIASLQGQGTRPRTGQGNPRITVTGHDAVDDIERGPGPVGLEPAHRPRDDPSTSTSTHGLAERSSPSRGCLTG